MIATTDRDRARAGTQPVNSRRWLDLYHAAPSDGLVVTARSLDGSLRAYFSCEVGILVGTLVGWLEGKNVGRDDGLAEGWLEGRVEGRDVGM